ncbi:predicted protein [Postia placenta Mad-698-R]|uniref:OsmC-like protein n=1 Tax=Postia placenta MAD-698-R-SB12 TaxID=670580 RepID=A0A1X6NBZ9_9APHY|nr:hypothetical protein POSPLADRAFT_1052728 [Postia placenta MAD-698-R-SB12]EED85426.1 predicted protein [Postia placenta Mad-698-R]OSX66050.1 hypothetical protein POSPLADRAFT_1052728 [Postia placenta MAD-698-R-SB12]
MRPTAAAFRPLTHRITTGAAITHVHNSSVPQARGILTLKDHVYFAKATARGRGRSGAVKSNGDCPLELKMATPKIIGGTGDGHNPEQLFGMGYASCFLGSLQLMASRMDKKHVAEDAKVHPNVFLGHPDDPTLEGFGLRVEITVEGCEDDDVITAAHEYCAYSRMLKHGANVRVTKA